MRPFSPRMFPHRVELRSLVGTKGSSGGPDEEFADPVGDPLPCRVRYASDREGFAAAMENSIRIGQVAFPADPGVKLGDQLLYGNQPLRVVGPAQPRDAFGVLFVVQFNTID